MFNSRSQHLFLHKKTVVKTYYTIGLNVQLRTVCSVKCFICWFCSGKKSFLTRVRFYWNTEEWLHTPYFTVSQHKNRGRPTESFTLGAYRDRLGEVPWDKAWGLKKKEKIAIIWNSITVSCFSTVSVVFC